MAQKEKFELKEYIPQQEFVGLLHQLLNACEKGKKLDLTINKEDCNIPREAFENARYRVEYEIEDGEYELEFTMKWR